MFSNSSATAITITEAIMVTVTIFSAGIKTVMATVATKDATTRGQDHYHSDQDSHRECDLGSYSVHQNAELTNNKTNASQEQQRKRITPVLIIRQFCMKGSSIHAK